MSSPRAKKLSRKEQAATKGKVRQGGRAGAPGNDLEPEQVLVVADDGDGAALDRYLWYHADRRHRRTSTRRLCREAAQLGFVSLNGAALLGAGARRVRVGDCVRVSEAKLHNGMEESAAAAAPGGGGDATGALAAAVVRQQPHREGGQPEQAAKRRPPRMAYVPWAAVHGSEGAAEHGLDRELLALPFVAYYRAQGVLADEADALRFARALRRPLPLTVRLQGLPAGGGSGGVEEQRALAPLRAALADAGGGPRARPHGCFRNNATDSLSEYGVTWMSSGTKHSSTVYQIR
jgi:hypothetical protein